MASPAEQPRKVKDNWNSRLGVILAVAGSAVGLGNFLRFPGQVAEYGGGAFMIAYFIAFVLLGLPICWAEWTMGRYGGRHGFNSAPAIMAIIVRHPVGKWVGIIGVVIPVIIYMFYVLIEAWCLGYAVNFLAGNMNFPDPDASKEWLFTFIGATENGSGLGFRIDQVGIYLVIVFVLNFFLIYRGVAKGIEWFCKYAMPALILLAVIILIKALTIGTPNPEQPQNNIENGLGFMWNPTKTFVVTESTNPETGETTADKLQLVGKRTIAEARDEVIRLAHERDVLLERIENLEKGLLLLEKAPASKEMSVARTKANLENARSDLAAVPIKRIEQVGLGQQLLNGNLWIAAAGQLFFSLSVGFGVIITYSSYLRKDDDIVLSGLAATSANEFCEVAIGGMLTIPAAYAFLGLSSLAGMTSTFALGFMALPNVFSVMPGGNIFGFLFFFLLFLAAVTSSLSMLQPGIAFLEEALFIRRKASVAILGVITLLGCAYVLWFSEETRALDTFNFWAGTVLIYILATIQIIFFGWVLGVEDGLDEAHRGAAIRIPGIFRFIIRWISPAFLITAFSAFVVQSFGLLGSNPAKEVQLLFGGPDVDEISYVAWMGIGIIAGFALFCAVLVWRSTLFRNFARNFVEDRKELGS